MRAISVLAMSVVLLTGCGQDKPEPEPSATLTPSISEVTVFKNLSHEHLGKGEYPQTYPQSPPVGGAHSAAWLKCQAYDKELPKENAVHSLEHGGVWITYQPALAAAQVATLTGKTILNQEFVMVSPYTGQDSPVVVSTWGLQLKVASVDDPRIDAFVRAYAGGEQGGEKGVGCARTGVTLEQALQYNAAQK